MELITDGSDVFDEVAAEYDRNRPAYPDELVERACRIAGVREGDRVLEVGCGSGQLTRSLAVRGLDLVAVEPGQHLLSLAARNVQGSGRIEFVNARFEDAPLAHGRFRALFSAAAFQWLDPDVSWRKAARLLAPGGTLALMQYCGLCEERSAADQEALLASLARNVPDVAAEWPRYRDLAATITGVEERRGNVSEAWAWVGSHDVARGYAARLFRDVRIACVPRLLEQTADELNALLATASFFPRLRLERRQALQREHVEMYERLGRLIRSSTVAVLVTARRSAED
jgi:SAM-dependent methyltransferase